VRDKISLGKAQALKILQYSPGGKATTRTPTKICHWISQFILLNLGQGKEVSFPGLGTFYAKKTEITVPYMGAPEPGTRKHYQTIIIRFRPYESAKKMVKCITREGRTS